MKDIPIWQKITLTVDEAAVYSNIGVNRLRELMADPSCDFVLYVGSKRLIKRQAFEKFIATAYSI